MSTTASISNRRPKKDFTSITQLGLKAFALAQAHTSALTPRLPADLLDNLETDLESLSTTIHSAKHAKLASVAATSNQYEVLANAYTLVAQVRAALRRTKAQGAVKKAYGVGSKVRSQSVRDVLVAITQILERAKNEPDEAASLGLIQKDLTALTDAKTAIQTADATQEKARASAPQSTKERNQTANRILAAVAKIEGAGRIEYASDPALREQFEALGPTTPKRKKQPEPANPV